MIDELIELDFTLDPHAHHLRGEPRPDARPPRRVARGVHAALALGLLRAQPQGPRLLLVRLDDRGRGRLEGATTASGWPSSTTTRTAAAGSTTGSDSGYIYKLYGFDYIRELELLREAGFHPLEVIRAATLDGAEALGPGQGDRLVEPGKLADLVVVDENPLANLKVLYGTGAIRVDRRERGRCASAASRYTIKDGIVYDARQLLADVRRIVREAKDKEKKEIRQP